MSDRSTDDENRRSMTHDDNDADGGERNIDESLGASAHDSAAGPGGAVDRGSNDNDAAAVDDAYQEGKAQRFSDAGGDGDGMEGGASPLHDANGQRSSPFDENASSIARRRDDRADASANDGDEEDIETSPLGGELGDCRERLAVAGADAGNGTRSADFGASLSPDHARNTQAGSASAAGEEREESDTTDATPAPTGTDAGPMMIVGEGVCLEDLEDENEDCKPPARRDGCAVNKTEEDEEEGEEVIEALPPFVPEDTELPAAAYVPDTKYVISGARPPPREEESATFNCKCWQCQRGEGHHGAASQDQQKQQPPHGTPSEACNVSAASGQRANEKSDGSDSGNDTSAEKREIKGSAIYPAAQAQPRGSGDSSSDHKLVGATTTEEEAKIRPGGGSYQQNLPGAFPVSGPNEGRGEAGEREENVEDNISDENAENNDSDDSSNWEATPGAYRVPIRVAPDRPPMPAALDHHHVIEAHVAPSEDPARAEERRQDSLHQHIRERLLRNAPLVEATAVLHGEESGDGSRRPTLRNATAATSSASSTFLRRPSGQFLRTASSLLRSSQQGDLSEIGVESGGTPSPLNRARADAQVSHTDEERPGNRTKRHICVQDRYPWWTSRRTWTALALFAAAAALVLGLSIPLSRRSTDESESQPTSSGDQASPPSPPGNSPAFPPVNNTTLVPSSAPTALPSSSPLEATDTTEWKTMGSPITGLRNESGVTIHIDYSTGVFSFGYGPKSNMTFSGLSLAISDDGRTLVVGESGTDTVRVFQWDTEVNDWVQKGQTLKGERDCDGAHDDGARGRNTIRRRTHLSDDDPTQFLPCYLSFGYEVHISGDGMILGMSSIGYNHQAGMVRAYKWNEEQSAWVQLGSDLIGYERNQGFGGGGSISFSNDSITLAVLSTQSLRPDVAVEFGVQNFHDGPGFVQVYDWNGTAWAQRGDTVFGTNDKESLGFVDLMEDGHSIAVGTILGGHVEVYDWDESLQAWDRRGESIVAPIGEDNFGSPVLFASQDGNRLVIGSNYVGDGDTEGAYLVYVYSWDGSGWVQLDRMNILQSAVEWGAHHNTRVTNDGNFLAAAFTSGVLIFEWDGSRYLSKGGTVDGGREVAISNSGEVFAVGRPGDHSLGFGLGRTTVYEESTSKL